MMVTLVVSCSSGSPPWMYVYYGNTVLRSIQPSQRRTVFWQNIIYAPFITPKVQSSKLAMNVERDCLSVDDTINGDTATVGKKGGQEIHQAGLTKLALLSSGLLTIWQAVGVEYNFNKIIDFICSRILQRVKVSTSVSSNIYDHLAYACSIKQELYKL